MVQLFLSVTLRAGGKTAIPTLSRFGSMNWRNVLMPSFAFPRSVQAGSAVPPPVWHIEPVRSSTSMMSSGLALHGEHAVALARTLSLSIPRIFPKTVATFEVALTFKALYELSVVEQPGAETTQRMVTVVVTSEPTSTSFRAPADGP